MVSLNPEGAVALAQTLAETAQIPRERTPVVFCIGTDQIIGDALGPLVGTLLQENPAFSWPVYGTLAEPVDADTLPVITKRIAREHPLAYVIAVDAVVGHATNVGQIHVEPGPVRPGLALKKLLGEHGDLTITGVVARKDQEFGLMLVPLRLVYPMAQVIPAALRLWSHQLAHEPKHHAV